MSRLRVELGVQKGLWKACDNDEKDRLKYRYDATVDRPSKWPPTEQTDNFFEPK